MPAPNPRAMWLDGDSIIFEQCWPNGSNTNRKARAAAILKRINLGTWECVVCGDALGLHKRADAKFCGESCRKKRRRHGRILNKVVERIA